MYKEMNRRKIDSCKNFFSEKIITTSFPFSDLKLLYFVTPKKMALTWKQLFNIIWYGRKWWCKTWYFKNELDKYSNGNADKFFLARMVRRWRFECSTLLALRSSCSFEKLGGGDLGKIADLLWFCYV